MTKSAHKKQNKSSFFMMLLVVVLSLSIFTVYKSQSQPDLQCAEAHTPTSTPPKLLKTAADFFMQGDYDYESGNCKSAIENYSKALNLNPKYAEAFNNRAYTYMRMGNYESAIPDLNQALILRPEYVHALMNRGDIYNYYFDIDRKKALLDYDKVLKMGPSTYNNTSLCGHRLLAINNGWNLKVIFTLLTQGTKAGCK